MGGRRHRVHPPQRFHRRLLRGYAGGHRTAAFGGRTEGADPRLPQQRRRHHAGGREDTGDVRPERHRSGEHQRPHGRFAPGIPHRIGTDTPGLAAGGARQRQLGIGIGDRDGSVAGSRPRGHHRPAQLRQRARADPAPAGIQRHAEAHHRQILHPFGTLHTGHRLFPLAGGYRSLGTRLAHLGIHDPRRTQGLRRGRHHARHPHRTGVHQPLRHDALCAGIHRGFRGRIRTPAPGTTDRHPHVLDHGR